MSNYEHLSILRKGVDIWNTWRREYPDVQPDLSEINFSDFIFDSEESEPSFGTRSNIYPEGLNLQGINFQSVDFQEAFFQDILVEGADFREAVFGNCHFIDTDFSNTIGLNNCLHFGRSFIDTRTLKKSKGQISIEFLQGCGLQDWEIEATKLYQLDLSNEEILNINNEIFEIRSTQAFQINDLFISYSHLDKGFVDHICEQLKTEGIRYYRDTHHATAGRLETQIDQAMRLNDTVLLVLSQHSTNSDWVEHEVRKARKLEKELGRDVICPVALDDSWKDCRWPARLREQIEEYNILDFSEWEKSENFEQVFEKLLNGLDLFY